MLLPVRLLDYFSSSYVVNLPSRLDRREEMVKMLAHVGMVPQPGKLEFFPAIRPPSQGMFPSLGARGCFLSHLEILRAAHRQGAERVLIMEDDLEIGPRLPAVEGTLTKVLSSRPWGLVYFGHVAEGDVPPSPDGLVSWNGETSCTHFYGVNGPLVPRLIEYLEAVVDRPAGHPEGGAMHYDGALSMFRTRDQVETLFATPNLGWQRSSRSDIHANKWFDRLPVTRIAVSGLRKLRNVLRLRRPRGS